MATSYHAEVAPGKRRASSCWPPQPEPITSGQKGQVVRLSLSPPQDGWCRGRYHVTVFLERGPYCPPSEEPQPCPEFATQDLDTGETHFRVR